MCVGTCVCVLCVVAVCSVLSESLRTGLKQGEGVQTEVSE